MIADERFVEVARGMGLEPSPLAPLDPDVEVKVAKLGALAVAVAAFGGGAWVAVTHAGIKCVGNGRGDAGRGATWEDALATLRAKNGAREARLRAIAAHEEAQGRVSRNALLVLGALVLVGLCAAAAWWAAR